MSLRLAVAWLERRFRAVFTGDPEDLDDWLAGNDDDIIHRDQGRRLATVMETGGEVG